MNTSKTCSSQRLRLIRLFIIVAFLCFLSALVAYGYLGTFTRYYRDDFSYGAVPQSLSGFWEYQEKWYTTWSGRFSFTFLIGLTSLVGPGIVPVLPSVHLAVWLLALSWIGGQTGRLFGMHRPLPLALLLSSAILFATLKTTPDMFESLYWQVGSLTYTLPLVLLTIFIGIVVLSYRPPAGVAQRPPYLLMLAGLLLTWVAGGLSETFVTLQITLIVLAILFSYGVAARAIWQRRVLPVLLAGLAGSLLALLLIALAPGNAVRQEFFTPAPNMVTLAKWTLYHALSFVYSIPRQGRLVLPVLMVIALLAAWLVHPPDDPPERVQDLRRYLTSKLQWVVLCAIAGYVLVMSALLPSLFSRSKPPPERALIIPYFVCLCLIACGSYLLGLFLRQLAPTFQFKRIFVFLAPLVVSGLLLVGPLRTAWHTFGKVPQAHAFVQAQEQREQRIRDAVAQGRAEIEIPYLGRNEALGCDDAVSITADWTVSAMSKYYGITIRLEEPAEQTE
jgi:hypothetical protein